MKELMGVTARVQFMIENVLHCKKIQHTAVFSKEDLLEKPGFGPKSVREVEVALGRHGLKLRG